MLNTLGIVEVGSANQPPLAQPRHTIAARRFGTKSLLEWVVRRVTEAQRLDQVLIVGLGDQPAAFQAAPSDVPVHVGSDDPLRDYVTALDEYPAAAVVRVKVANPFIDPVMIDRLVTAADGFRGDYLSYCFSDGRPVVHSQLGVLAEWCRGDALRQADREAADPRDRQDPMRYVYSRPDRFQLRLIPAPTPLDRDDLRLLLDSEEDWDHAQEIYDALGPEGLDFQTIAGLLDNNPAIRQRMAVLNRGDG